MSFWIGGKCLNQIIYLLRHGETVLNTQGRYQGELDSPLTAIGIEQVQQNADMLKSLIGDSQQWQVFSSPLGRALQSTEIICNTMGYDFNNVQQDNRLAEVAVGDWAGLTTKEIEHTWPTLLDQTDHYNWFFNAPNGESYDAVVSRLTDWLDSIKDVPKVIVISHGLTGRILRGIYAGLAKEDALKLDVSQDVFFKLTHKNIQNISLAFDDFY